MGIEAEVSRNILADPDVIWEQLTDEGARTVAEPLLPFKGAC